MLDITKKKKVDQNHPLTKASLELCKIAEREDDDIRKRQMRLWKKLDLFWHGIQHIIWDQNDGIWLSPTDMSFERAGVTPLWDQDEEPDYTNVVNIYRAHGESIIAALSAQVPGVRFPPDNADDEDDLIASKVHSKIADLISKHNKAQIIQLQALLALWNEGLVAAYCYNKQDKNYGQHKIPEFRMEPSCPTCEVQGDSEDLDVIPSDVPKIECPNCGEPMSIFYALRGFSQLAKSRTKVEIFGPLSVKVPYYSRCQEEFGYVLLYNEMTKGMVVDMYPEFLENSDSTGEADTYERSARTPSTFGAEGQFDTVDNLVTMRRAWLRPFHYNELGINNVDEIKQLQKKYPDGMYVCSVGDTILEIRGEELDKHWRFGKAGLSRFIHSDPVGLPLVELQEMTNTLVNLTQETIEHGIPTTFADGEVLDLGAYGSQTQRPGTITTVKAKMGQRLSDAFFEGTRATISREVGVTNAYYEKMGQFVVGSFPSIYGGDSKSKTASEYSQSRQMALQRLSITYKMFSHWWANMIECCVNLFVEGMVTDEQFTDRKDGNYVSVWIRQAELVGKVGGVEPEADDSFPVSTAAKQALLMKLIELNNEALNAAIFDESNRRLVGDALGFPDFNIPGEDQRIKQAREIEAMLKGEMADPEFDVDDHPAHIAQCKNWAVSTVGLETKRINPQAYQLVINHLIMHTQMDQQKQMMDASMGQPPAGPNQEQQQDVNAQQ